MSTGIYKNKIMNSPANKRKASEAIDSPQRAKKKA